MNQESSSQCSMLASDTHMRLHTHVHEEDPIRVLQSWDPCKHITGS